MMKSYERALFFYRGYLRDAPDATNRPVVLGLIDEMERARAAEEAATKAAEEDRRARAVVVVAPPKEPPSTPVGHTEAGRGLGASKVLALTSAGVGVLGLGFGVALGAVALSQKSSAEAACPGSVCPTAEGVHAWSTAASTGNVSTVLLVVGGLGIAGGAVLGSPPRARPRRRTRGSGFGPGTLLLSGAW